jgi:hypothetical protein
VIVNVANVATYTAKITKKIINLIYNFKQKTSNKCIFACSASLLKDLKEVLNVVLNFIYKKSNFLKKSSSPIISKYGYINFYRKK